MNDHEYLLNGLLALKPVSPALSIDALRDIVGDVRDIAKKSQRVLNILSLARNVHSLRPSAAPLRHYNYRQVDRQPPDEVLAVNKVKVEQIERIVRLGRLATLFIPDEEYTPIMIKEGVYDITFALFDFYEQVGKHLPIRFPASWASDAQDLLLDYMPIATVGFGYWDHADVFGHHYADSDEGPYGGKYAQWKAYQFFAYWFLAVYFANTDPDNHYSQWLEDNFGIMVPDIPIGFGLADWIEYFYFDFDDDRGLAGLPDLVRYVSGRTGYRLLDTGESQVPDNGDASAIPWTQENFTEWSQMWAECQPVFTECENLAKQIEDDEGLHNDMVDIVREVSRMMIESRDDHIDNAEHGTYADFTHMIEASESLL